MANQSTPVFEFRDEQIPFMEGDLAFILADEMDAVKSALRWALPEIKPTHRLDLFARAGGYRTAAAMHAKMKKDGCFYLAMPQDDAASWARDLVSQYAPSGTAGHRVWEMTRYLRFIVHAWVCRERYNQPQPETDGAALREAEDWGPRKEGALLAKHLFETNNAARIIGLPGAVAGPAFQNPALDPVERVARMNAGVGLALAVDAIRMPSLMAHLELNSAATGMAIGNIDHDHLGLVSDMTGKMIGMMIARRMPENTVPYPHSGYVGPDGSWVDEGSLDEWVLFYSAQEGLPISIAGLAHASLLLAACMTGLSISVAAERAGVAEGDFRAGVPAEFWQEKDLHREHTVSLIESGGASKADMEMYQSVADEHWRERPLLDAWLELASDASDHVKGASAARA